MKHWGVERRRAPRVKPPQAHRLLLNGSLTVQVMDFSTSGVLLASKVELCEGDHAELRVLSQATSVRVPIEIRHVSRQVLPRVGARFCAGAAFQDLSPEQRTELDAVLRERT